MIKYSVDKVKPKNGSNVLAWNSEGEKQTCYFVKDQFKLKYDRGDEFENVEWWSYAILDDRQSWLFDQFAILLAMSYGEAQVMQFSANLGKGQVGSLLSEIEGVRKSAFEYCKDNKNGH